MPYWNYRGGERGTTREDTCLRLGGRLWLVFLTSHLESTGHGLAEPDVLLLFHALAEVPVLHGDGGFSGVDASLAGLHVTVDLDGIQSGSLVGVNEVHS